MESRSLKDFHQKVSESLNPNYRAENKLKNSWKHKYTSFIILFKQKIGIYTFFRPSLLVALFYILYVIGQLSIQKFDPKSFIFVGTRWLNNDSNGSIGYDGQFYYYIAQHLFNTPLYMLDIPSLRSQRILYPLLIRLFSLGQNDLMPWVMIFINVGAIIVGTEVLDRLLRLKGLNPWYSLVYGLFIGQLWSVRRDLTEPLVYMFVLLAVYSYYRKSSFLSIIFFNLALFSKETAIFFVSSYIVNFLIHRKFKSGISFAILTLFPYILFQIFLMFLFGDSGFIRTTVSLQIIPFDGIYQNMIRAYRPIVLPELLNMIFLTIIPSSLSFILALRKIFKKEFEPAVFHLLLNACAIIFLHKYSFTDIINYGRHTTTLVTSFMIFSAITKNKQLLKFSLLWVLPLTTYFTYGG